MRRVLMTGLTSFAGLALAARLATEGNDVHAIVRPSTDTARVASLPAEPTLHVHDGATESLQKIVKDVAPDIVFHLAGRYIREHNPGQVEILLRDNVTFGTQLLEALSRSGGGRFVNTGSYFQYQESGRYSPVNLYAAAKQAFADILAVYAESGAVQAVTLVLFDTYGKGDWRPRLMAAIHDAQRSGKAVPLPAADAAHDFVYIDDVADAYVRAAALLEKEPERVRNQAFAVRAEKPATIGEIIRVFEDVGKRPVPQAWGAYPTPPGRASMPWRGPLVPGWQPRVSLRDGIQRFIAGR